jgi:hypothetical protein
MRAAARTLPNTQSYVRGLYLAAVVLAGAALVSVPIPGWAGAALRAFLQF